MSTTANLFLMNPAENYILEKPEPYTSMLMHIKSVIEHTVPGVVLKYKYKLPFYYLKGKPFCYLNVNAKKQFVDLGFCRGNKLSLHTKYMVVENRKVMKSLRYTQLKEIDNRILTDVLHEAHLLYT